MKTVAFGGTFDIVHKGHEALLRKAFELGDLVHIGITTDEFANANRNRKVRSFDERRKDLLAMAKQLSGDRKFTIVPIKDTYGLTLEKDLDFLVVSPETVRMADKINYLREEEGKPKIKVVVVEYVLAKDGRPISSTRVGNREFDPQGNIVTEFTPKNFPCTLIPEQGLTQCGGKGNGREPVLIHICCGPCISYPLDTIFSDRFPVGFFYNPNIHPFQEYRRRLEVVKEFASEREFRVIYQDDYDIERFMKGVGKEGYERGKRCRWCYRDRLERTAEMAKELGIRTISTSLLSSPHQLHDLVKEIGEEVAAEYGLEFLYYDTREQYQEGVETVRQMDLYVQNYCGCVFSESERFKKMLVQD